MGAHLPGELSKTSSRLFEPCLEGACGDCLLVFKLTLALRRHCISDVFTFSMTLPYESQLCFSSETPFCTMFTPLLDSPRGINDVVLINVEGHELM